MTLIAKLPIALLPSLISRMSLASCRHVPSTAGLLMHSNSSHNWPKDIPSTSLSASDLSMDVAILDEGLLPSVGVAALTDLDWRLGTSDGRLLRFLEREEGFWVTLVSANDLRAMKGKK